MSNELRTALPYLSLIEGPALKVALKRAASTAIGKFIGNARVIVENPDNEEKTGAAEKACETYVRIYQLVKELESDIRYNEKFDAPQSLSDMLDFMTGGRKVDANDAESVEAMIKGLMKKGLERGVAEEAVRSALSSADDKAENPLAAVRTDVEALWQGLQGEDLTLEPLGPMALYSFAQKLAGSLVKERARVAKTIAKKMATGQPNNMDFILRSVHNAKEALLEWAENFEKDELAEVLERAEERGYPVELVSSIFADAADEAGQSAVAERFARERARNLSNLKSDEDWDDDIPF
jgi:hypothetical protein